MSTQLRFDEIEADGEHTGTNYAADARPVGSDGPEAGWWGLSAILLEADPDIEFSELHRRAAEAGYVETPDPARGPGGDGE